MKRFTAHYFRLCSVICGAGLLLSSCVTTEEVGKMRWELNALRSEVRNIQKSTLGLEGQTPGETKDLGQTLRELQNNQETTSRTVSDLLLEVQDMKLELQKTTGQVEESRYYAEKSIADMIQSRDSLMARLNELEKKIAAFPAGGASVPPSAAAPTDTALTSPGEAVLREEKPAASAVGRSQSVISAAKDEYMAGYQAFREGRGDEARQHFTSVLKNYPPNDYSDNARFWIAESYYQDGSFEDAILAYEELFRNNPSSDKIPGAMLKQGFAFYALKDEKTGKIILEKLIEKYPGTEQARLAEKKIGKSVPAKKF
ncbi:MAG: tol-pal system protein YbgF [Nitrospiraceae bacterium]|nr:MAG: tol-pal system protein YbgF [Nitrospiraceae bacterium]